MSAAHWVYLLGVLSLIVVMACRKTVVVPAVVATLLTALVATGSLATALGSVFRASLVAASELFNIFLIIALVSALLGALRAAGAEHLMVVPFRRIMVNGRVAFFVLFVVTYVFSLFFWPTPVLALVATILLPAALKAGLSPMGGAMAIAIGGQGMALASDYVIGVAPSLSASGAGVPADIIANRSLVLSLIVGGIAAVLSYVLTVRPSMGRQTSRLRALAAWFTRRPVPSPALVSATVGDAYLTKRTSEPVLDGPSTSGAGPDDVAQEEDTEEEQAPPTTRRGLIFAGLVPLSFLLLVGYMLLGRFSDVVRVEDGAGAGLVGGLAALLLLVVAISTDGRDALESTARHVVDGLAYAFKAMGVILPIAGFVYMGIADYSGRILGLADGATGPAFLFDAIRSVEDYIPGNPVVIALALLAAGMTVGLDGSGWAGLPLTGNLSAALGPHGGVDTATLAAIAQNGASWTGGGTLVIWSSLIAVAGFCRVDVVELARRLFVPVVTGLVVAALAGLFIW
ncbi:MAG TPA: hypothetical protein VFJ12_08680 [Segeticoccus sp.]|nr:hypothetical protein [Segeticoccus sp.]